MWWVDCKAAPTKIVDTCLPFAEELIDCPRRLETINPIYADVVELVDTPVLGTGAARREGSSPFIRTKS